MKVKITLVGEGTCRKIVECSSKEYEFLKEIAYENWDDDESYSPSMYVDEVTKQCKKK